MFTTEPEELPEGVKAFEMPDGSFVAVVRDEPLPDPVAAAITASLAQNISADYSEPGSRAKINDAAQTYAGRMWLRTGKNVVIIYPFFGSCSMAEDGHMGWTFTQVTGHDTYDETNCRLSETLQEAKDRAEALIAQEKNPAQFELVVREY